jgi:hypothetical protein
MVTTEAVGEFVRAEQVWLWDELDDAIRNAYNGRWSIRCGSVMWRIIEAARLIGAIPHDEVPWRLLAGGVYEAVLNRGGIAHTLPDADEWARLDALMERHGTRAEHRAKLVYTISSIQTEHKEG